MRSERRAVKAHKENRDLFQDVNDFASFLTLLFFGRHLNEQQTALEVEFDVIVSVVFIRVRSFPARSLSGKLAKQSPPPLSYPSAARRLIHPPIITVSLIGTIALTGLNKLSVCMTLVHGMLRHSGSFIRDKWQLDFCTRAGFSTRVKSASMPSHLNLESQQFAWQFQSPGSYTLHSHLSKFDYSVSPLVLPTTLSQAG